MSYAIVIYMFCIFPLLLGNLWVGKDRHTGFCKLYMYGYFTMLALFEVEAVFMVHRGSRLSSLGLLWGATMVGASLAAILYILIRRRLFFREYKMALADMKNVFGRLRAMLCILAFLGIFSVTMVSSSPEDATPEIVGISLNTNTMYLYQPYTQLPYADKTAVELAPTEMLYAVGAYLSGMDGRVLIHLIVPCFLILLYYAVGWRVGEYFFKEKLWEKGMFTTLWGVFATIGMASVRNLSVGMFQNSWNGITLFVCCAIPLIMAEAMDFWGEVFAKKKITLRQIACMGCIVLGAQLLYSRGVLLGTAVIVICVFSKLMEKRMNREKNAGIS